MSCKKDDALAATKRVLDDKLIVRPLVPGDKSPGGILLPESAQDRPTEGTVIAVGPGSMLPDGNLAYMPVSVGNSIVYSGYAGTEVEIGKSKYVLLRVQDVLYVN